MNGNRRFCFSVIFTALAAAAVAGPTLAQNNGSGTSVFSKNIPGPVPVPAAPPPPAPAPAPASEAQPPLPEPSGQRQAAAPQHNAVGAGWSTKFGTSSPESSAFTGTPEQVAVVEKINAYFNNLTNLQGNFLQTDADEKRKKGKFFIERPGKLRFDYALPSKQKIISNGEYLAIEDHDLNTTDRYPLDSTPFRLLLTKNVDLVRDARIVALDIGKDAVVITVEDKAQDSGGQIRLFFDWPELQLKEWIITDPQGLNTRIQVADVELNKAVKPEVFKFSPDIGLPKFKQ